MQFEHLVANAEFRTLTLDTPPARFLLTRYDNVVSCECELKITGEGAAEALARRGAVDGTFMIRRNLAPKEFGVWLDQLLVDDLKADPNCEAGILTTETLTLGPWEASSNEGKVLS